MSKKKKTTTKHRRPNPLKNKTGFPMSADLIEDVFRTFAAISIGEAVLAGKLGIYLPGEPDIKAPVAPEFDEEHGEAES